MKDVDMTDKKTEALKLAEQPAQQPFNHTAAANAALREAQNRSYQIAMAAQQHEPVAWMYQCSADSSGPVLMQHKRDWAESGSGLWTETPLYTSPQPAQQQEPVKLWLWKNFVDGRPEYWAFDNAFPINMNDGDPQTVGEPCGYAWLKPSRQGRFDVSDEEVLRAVQNAKKSPPASKPWVGLTDEEIWDEVKAADLDWQTGWSLDEDAPNRYITFARAIEAKLKEKNA